MPASTFMPDITVEIAFATAPDDPSPTWTDVSTYVEAVDPITISRGRSDEISEIQPSRLTVTLDNSDGRFTPGNASGAYYPNVKKNRMVRVSAVWPLGGGGTTYRRFHGYIDEWPVSWPNGNGEYASVTVTASSRRARLALGTELRSIIEEEYLADGPIAYYPLGEASPGGGTPGQAGDVSGNQQPNLVATGSAPGIQWQAATGPGTDSLSAPLFSGGKYLEMLANQPLADSGDASFTVEAFINTTNSAAPRAIATLASGFWYSYLGINVANQLFAGSPSYSVSSAATINDGLTHHVAVRETTSGGTTTLTLFLDGVSVDSDTTSAVATDRSRLLVASMTNDSISDKWSGTISHIAVFAGTALTDARISAHAAAGLTGFYGESTDERIFRLAEYAGVDAFVDTESGLTTSIINQDTTGRTPIDLMDEVTQTEGGILFDATDGTLTFHARTHRYNATSQYTLDASQDQIEATLEAKMDGQQLVNDITATGGSSIVVRAVNADSITEHGVRRDQVELLTLVDNEVYDAANWRVQRYGEPDVRISAVQVDLLNQSSSLISELLDTELGTRITLSNLPDQAPAASLEVFIEGIAETIGAESYTITFELSPVVLSDVWQLDSASYSQLDQTTVLAY